MEEITVPCSPSWYLSQALDCSWDDRLAYASLSHIVIINPSNPTNPTVLTNAHDDRITSVSFSSKRFGNCLLSTCTKGLSVVWNLDSRKALSFNRAHRKNITYGDWSHANENLIVCADENGGVSWWDVKSNILKYSTFVGHIFNVVACCPHHKELVAAGTKQGLTCVINVKGTGSILHKLQDHNSEIVSIVWCPISGNLFRSNGSQNDHLLCTASRGRSVHFWRVGKDNFCEARIELPSSGPKIPGNNFSFWTCLCWPHPTLLLASVMGGDVFSLKVKEISNSQGAQLVGRAANRDKKANWQQLFASVKHGRGHVTVHCRPWEFSESSSEFNWRSESSEDVSRLVWTSGSDRVIYGISMKNGKEVQVDIKLNTLGGVIHALAVSPIDGHCLAIGGADRAIRVVNLSDSSFHYMKTFFLKYNAKVMALSWHPIKEDWLACGTSDGHVDVHSAQSNKVHLSFKQHTKESIYVLQWGPLVLPSTGGKEVNRAPIESDHLAETLQYALYSVGGGKVAMFNPDKVQNPELKSLDPLKGLLPSEVQSAQGGSKITDLSWKPDYTMLAIGNDKGSVILFYLSQHQNLHFMSCVKEHVNLIQDLAWHPESCLSDVSEKSPYCNWLASASNDMKIRILDTTSALAAANDWKDGSDMPDVKVPCAVTLVGHRQRVAKVSWSPHQSGQLLSASYDQCVQVWDVPEQQPVACYIRHGNPVLACLWSPVDANFALSGGMDSTLRVWSIPNQDQILPTEKKTDSKHYLKEAAEVELSAMGNAAENEKNTILASESVCSKCKKRKEKAVLSLSGQAVNDESLNSSILRHLLMISDEEPPNGESDSIKSLPLHYGLFGDEAAMARLLNAEHEANSSAAAWDSALVIDSWRGRVKEALAEAIQKKCLSDFHVSLAPMVSSKTWVETCVAYAEQLKEKKEYSKASTFLLAIHKVEDAIKLLAENGKYRQALAIARSRLPSDDPIIQELLSAWAEHTSSQGQLSVASLCLAATGQWNDAARLVVRKQTPARLLLAAQMMVSKGNDTPTGLLYARECLLLSLKARDWDSCKSVLQSFPDLNHFSVLLLVHNSISNFLKRKNGAPDWLKDKCSLLVTNACTDVPENSDIPGTKLILEKQNEEKSGTSVVKPIHLTSELVSNLKNDLQGVSTDTKEDALWLAVSSKVALAVALAPSLFSCVQNNVTYDASVPEDQSAVREALSFVVQAMALLYNHHIMQSQCNDAESPLLKLCMWLFPDGDLKHSRLLSRPSEPLQETIGSYLAASILFWLECAVCSDQGAHSHALRIIEHFKTGLFSIQSVKWFKVDFQYKLLKDKKMREESLKEKSLNKEVSSASLECSTGLENKLTDDEDKENSVLSEESNPNEADTELERLTSWLQKFEEDRGRVPNPYLCYGRLISFLKNSTGKLDESEANSLYSSYQEFWKDVESQVENT